MKDEKKYSSMIKDMGLLAQEMKIAAGIFKETGDLNAIVGKSITFNVFMVNAERRRKDLATRIVNRLASVEPEIILLLADASLNIVNALSLYIFMKSDRLVFEFMYEVYKDKIDHRERRIRDIDLKCFFAIKAQQNDAISKWKQSNIDKVLAALKNCLVDAGLAKYYGKELLIEAPLLPKDIQDLIVEKGDLLYLQAMGAYSL